MKLTDLLDDQNRLLFKALSQRIEIQLVPNEDWREEVWHTKIEMNSAIIYYPESDVPEAQFTFQLLLIELHLDGYKPITNARTADTTLQHKIPSIIKHLNHILPCYKVADKFNRLGYKNSLIELESSESTIRFIKDQLGESGQNPLEIALLYLNLFDITFFAEPKNLQSIKNQIKMYNQGKYSTMIESIDSMMNRWLKDDDCNAKKYIIEFLRNAQGMQIWLSTMVNGVFPNNGYFVEKPFDLAK